MFDDLKRLEEQLLIGSTLVEGSTLSEEEAREVLAGRTVSGHPIRELRELITYRSGVEWLGQQLQAVPYLSHDLILGFHRILMRGEAEAGEYKRHRNYTMRLDGGRHDFVAPERVLEAVDEWLQRFNAFSGKDRPETLFDEAAELYFGFEHIHPFADGNGRIGRIFLAYWLYSCAGLRLRFHLADKHGHLVALQAADDGDLTELVAFFRDRADDEAPGGM